ncbi:hypothetical protein AKJ55_01130 [candidate division MSBL1 archaeon SCGC-AAA382M17]|uniref:ABC transporter domain-containing protein n=1 Tax=candidate division MSBL1 archaeon SCGC-AAA382M17 TaxID=1698284 RepID=A0ABR5TJJ4_9EURY|nr:hypothetical protein AKJ55_01130 [candidate division MSBL1 archaeon SCGC-AAA382M17]
MSDKNSNPIEFDGITKRYGDLLAVNSVNFDISEGEFFGLLGPNGAGKTTLINMLIGLVSPSEGTAYVYGSDIVEQYQRVHSHIGFAPAEENFDREFNVYENLKFHGGYFGVPTDEQEARAKKYLKMFDLWDKRKDETYKLSTGMRRKLLFARALMTDPDILILDEPTSGLDVETRNSVHDYLTELDRTILLTSHQIEEAEKLCDRVAIMDEGEILAIETPKKLKHRAGTDRVEIRLAEKIRKVPSGLDQDGFKSALGEEGYTIEVVVPNGSEAVVEISEKLFEEGLEIESIDIKKSSLEDVFLRLT